MTMMSNCCRRHHCISSHEHSALEIGIAWHKQICELVAPLKRNFIFISFRRRSIEYSRQIAMSLSSYLLNKALVGRFLYIKTANE
jgi:hypothetical protein